MGVVVGGELDSRQRRVRRQLRPALRLRALRRSRLRRSRSRRSRRRQPPTSDRRQRSCSSTPARNSLRVKHRPDRHARPRRPARPRTGAHLGLGARRAVSEHSDLGARVEYDDLDGTQPARRAPHRLSLPIQRIRLRSGSSWAPRATPWQHRPTASTTALGLQWRDVLPHVDVGIDLRYYDSVARDHLLPSDPQCDAPGQLLRHLWRGAVPHATTSERCGAQPRQLGRRRPAASATRRRRRMAAARDPARPEPAARRASCPAPRPTDRRR